MIPIYKQTDRESLRARLARRRSFAEGDVVETARRIIAEVRREGDDAVLRFTRELDGIEVTAERMIVDSETLRAAAAKADPRVVRELEKAIFNIHAYHKRQVQKSWEFRKRGVLLGQRVLPLESVGVYVPGGSAAYPSSVLMNVIPAKIAGVQRIAVTTPPGAFERNPVLAAALQELRVHEIYLVGGAQAIAALACGTATIPRVDKIVGPGNAWVSAAKREVYGEVDVDLIAGPSEVVVLASSESNPRFIAADMLAQAEHDELASSICFTDSVPHAVLIQGELEHQLGSLPRKETAEASLRNFGGIVVLDNYFLAVDWINELAPEHLEIFSSIPDSVIDLIRNAGAIFYGDHSPEAVGDYFAGSNHVLPTSGTARFFSPLGVYDFQRRTSVIKYTKAELQRTWKSIDTLARAEGLEAHARSVRIRQEEGGEDG